MNQKTEKISIVICTRNRAKYLEICLESLLDQTVSNDHFEVIVVDNDSADSTPEICRMYKTRINGFKYILEKEIGLSHARNTGYKTATTDWVGYLDDDGKAHNNYVERALWIINNYNFDAFGGRYLPWYPDGKPSWIPDDFGTNGYLTNKTDVLPYPKYFSGGLCFIKKELLNKTGGFLPEYGMKGNQMKYGEEVFLQLELRERGKIIGFDPELNMDHLVAKYKQNVWWILRSIYLRNIHYYKAINKKPDKSESKHNLHVILIGTLRNLKNNFPKLLFNKEYEWERFIFETFSDTIRYYGRLVGSF